MNSPAVDFLLVSGQCGVPTSAGSLGLPSDQWETVSGDIYHSREERAVIEITAIRVEEQERSLAGSEDRNVSREKFSGASTE